MSAINYTGGPFDDEFFFVGSYDQDEYPGENSDKNTGEGNGGSTDQDEEGGADFDDVLFPFGGGRKSSKTWEDEDENGD